MPRLIHAHPKYSLHKSTGQAFVVLDGRFIYLGRHGTASSRKEYERVLGEWLANGRRLPGSKSITTVREVLAAFWTHAQAYYRKPDGTPAGELENFRLALQPVKRLYGDLQAVEFGPLALKAVRDAMLAPRTLTNKKTGKRRTSPGWCRTYANRQVNRIKHVFKWATENELVPPGVYQALVTVAGLRKGRGDVRESKPVKPVDEAHVAAAIEHMSPPVRALVELQLLTGARGGELRRMRTCDVDTSAWVYRPAAHKTAHHGIAREIWLGPKAQAVLRPFLKPDLQAFVFSPADAEAWRHQQQREKRRTKVTPSQQRRAERARARADQRKRAPKAFYDSASYRRAIARACQQADARAHKLAPEVQATQVLVPSWHPHQLRHTAATRIRRRYGLEAARVVLGHQSGAITEVYAEQDAQLAAKVMGEVG